MGRGYRNSQTAQVAGLCNEDVCVTDLGSRCTNLLGSLSEVVVLDESRDSDAGDTRGPGRHAHARLPARGPKHPPGGLQALAAHARVPAASTPSAWCAAVRGPRTLPRGRPCRPLAGLSGRSWGRCGRGRRGPARRGGDAPCRTPAYPEPGTVSPRGSLGPSHSPRGSGSARRSI